MRGEDIKEVGEMSGGGIGSSVAVVSCSKAPPPLRCKPPSSSGLLLSSPARADFICSIVWEGGVCPAGSREGGDREDDGVRGSSLGGVRVIAAGTVSAMRTRRQPSTWRFPGPRGSATSWGSAKFS